MMPMMSKTERDTISKYLKPNWKMLEWGSGGSTIYFSSLVEKYYSIEHDPAWYEKVKKELTQNNINNVEYIFSPMNVEKHKEKEMLEKVYGGHKISEDRKPVIFRNYIDAVERLGDNKYDAILIDGRARPWCCQKVLPYMTKQSIIFFHDYSVRPRYHVVEKYLEKIEEVQTLSIMKKR